MKVYWRAYTELADGHKMYIKEFIAIGNHHHTPFKKEAQRFTTDQKHKLNLNGYYWERVLKSEK